MTTTKNNRRRTQAPVSQAALLIRLQEFREARLPERFAGCTPQGP